MILATYHGSILSLSEILHHETWHAAQAFMGDEVQFKLRNSFSAYSEKFGSNDYLLTANEKVARAYSHYAGLCDEHHVGEPLPVGKCAHDLAIRL